MEQNQKILQLLLAVSCGAITFAIVFVAVPQLSVGLPDPVWILLMILLPPAAAVILLEQIGHAAPVYTWAGLPIQYILLCFLAHPISDILGTSVDGLSWFTFVFQAITWPFIVTLLQFCAVVCIRKMKRRARR